MSEPVPRPGFTGFLSAMIVIVLGLIAVVTLIVAVIALGEKRFSDASLSLIAAVLALGIVLHTLRD